MNLCASCGLTPATHRSIVDIEPVLCGFCAKELWGLDDFFCQQCNEEQAQYYDEQEQKYLCMICGAKRHGGKVSR